MKAERIRRQKDDDDERRPRATNNNNSNNRGGAVLAVDSEDEDLKPNPLVAQDEEVCRLFHSNERARERI